MKSEVKNNWLRTNHTRIYIITITNEIKTFSFVYYFRANFIFEHVR